MTAARSIIAVLLLGAASAPFTGAAARADGLPVLLEAGHGDQVSWRLRLSGCQVEAAELPGRPAPAPAALSLPPGECQSLRTLLRSARPDDPSFSPAGRVETVTDEPEYFLTVGGTRKAVSYRPASECRILATGDLRCAEERPLTPAQRLLLPLRRAARQLGLAGTDGP